MIRCLSRSLSSAQAAQRAAPASVAGGREAASTADVVAWPHNALSPKLVSSGDMLDAVAAYAAQREDEATRARATRVMTRTLLAYGGWVVPAHHVLVKERVHGNDIWLPPVPDLYVRAEHDCVLAFSDKAVHDMWRQQARAARPSDSALMAVAEHATGMRLFDALWSSGAVRALAVRSLRVDADPALSVPLEPFRTALLTAKIERAAAVLTLYRHGKESAAQRYVTQTFASFRLHRLFYVVDDAAARHTPLPRSRLFAFTDELLLQDACAKFGLPAALPFRVLSGAQLLERLLEPTNAIDALWLNFHTPLSLLLPRDLLAELNQTVTETKK